MAAMRTRAPIGMTSSRVSVNLQFLQVRVMRRSPVDDRVSALIGIAPPVVTSVSGMEYAFPNTLASTKPKFFVQGESDEVCPIQGMWAFYGKLPEPKELVVIDGADHLFTGQAPEVGEALQDLLGDYE